jgi:hypothetical protein
LIYQRKVEIRFNYLIIKKVGMMTELSDRKWSLFKLKDIFPEICRGKRLKNADHKSGVMPYISSSASLNGIDDFVSNKYQVRIFSDCLTIANSGSVGATFYHPYEFVASDHVTSLKNPVFNKSIYLFISVAILKIGEKYSFNREINESRIMNEIVFLPINSSGFPDYDFMEEYVRERKTRLIKAYLEDINHESLPPPPQEWRQFLISDIFNIKPGKRLTKEAMTPGERPFIGASDSNNGVTNYVSNINESLDHDVLGVNYNGSVVKTFYHPYECIFSDDVKRFSLKSERKSIFVFLFLKTIIEQQREKYTYGYKFNERRMSKQSIMLPVDKNGNPDWDYMENYTKSIMNHLVNIYHKHIGERNNLR